MNKQMDDNSPIYSSRIIKGYLEYITTYYPQVDTDAILRYAEIKVYQVNDQAHWFNQKQTDRFNEITVELTGNPNIPREVGVHATSLKAFSVVVNAFLGLIKPTMVFLLMGKIYPTVSRGAKVITKKLGANKMEIIVTPKPGVREKEYQCMNRLGNFEAILALQPKNIASLDHPSCINKGDDCCRYIITWAKNISLSWLKIRNRVLLFNGLGCLGLYFFLSPLAWSAVFTVSALTNMALSLYAERREKIDLTKTIENQSNVATELLDEANIRYNNALLSQEISRVTSKVMDVPTLVKRVTHAMKDHLSFDYGLILLKNRENRSLFYAAGYGFNRKQEDIIKEIEFKIDVNAPENPFLSACKQQKPVFWQNNKKSSADRAALSRRFFQAIGVQSLVCIPIVYEKESLGVLAVDNMEKKGPITQSSLNILMGVSSQTAATIVHTLNYQKLQESEERYRTIIETIEDGYFEVNLNGDMTFCNDALCGILKYPKDELIGMTYHEYVDEINAEKIFQTFNEVFRTGISTKVTDWKLIRKTGEPCFVQTVVSLAKDSKDIPMGFKGIARDITESKLAEKKLKQAIKDAKKANQAKSDFLANMSHELRTPLNHVIGFTELIVGKHFGDLNETQEEYLTDILSSSNHLLSLINDILDISKVEAGKQKFVPTGIDLRLLLEESLVIIKEKAVCQGIELSSAINGIPETVTGDERMLKQILYNLLSNAIKFTTAGGKIALSATTVLKSTDVNERSMIDARVPQVKISVVDTGIGINPKELDRIFNPFEQLENSTSRKFHGTGLGLSLSKNLVQLHGGKLWAESEGERKGSAFHFIIPV
ncbi:ATP-binding protein [Thermodesulfobacteriota bacterium]